MVMATMPVTGPAFYRTNVIHPHHRALVWTGFSPVYCFSTIFSMQVRLRHRHALPAAALLFSAGFFLWLTAFYVVDSDFWWHVKAGEVMWSALRSAQGDILIRLDPFAWTREGLPYVATHEWLAQLLFYGAFHSTGAAGVIALRWLSVCAIAGLLLSLDRKNMWPNVFLVMAAAVVMRQGLLERPQLFSNVLFAATVVLLYRYVSADAENEQRRILLWLIPLQILWVNLHGAASLLMMIPLGAVIVHEGWDVIAGHQSVGALRRPVLMIPALLLAMLLSPNGVHNFTYLHLLFTDQTKDFIQEWSPRSWGQYLPQIGPFWLIALAALAAARYRMLASGALLIGTGILSRMGSRHEALFLIAAAAVTIAQLRQHARWGEWMEQFRGRRAHAWILTTVLCGGLVALNLPYHRFLTWRGIVGVGTEEIAAGAYDFLEREGIGKRMFNTYAIGGYLLYRGAPERKVFVDGRNVDYGFAFLKDALDARWNLAIWRALDQRYRFDVAVIEYAPRSSSGTLEFAFLSGEAGWALVYIDDGVAVYAKRSPEHADLIARNGYELLTPGNVADGSILRSVDSRVLPRLKEELGRMAAGGPRAARGQMLLDRIEKP